MVPFLKTSQNYLKKSHDSDFFNLPCSHYKLRQVDLFIATFKNILKLYFSFIHIYISYANIAWASTFKIKL